MFFIFFRSRVRQLVLFSAIACMIRPTNAVIWVFLYANLLWAFRLYKCIVITIVIQLVSTVYVFFTVVRCLDQSFNRAISLAFLFILDSLYYGKPTFTPLNFLRTNFSSVSLFYGMNAWHYYLTQAVPILCTTALPFTMHGIWSTLISEPLRNTKKQIHKKRRYIPKAYL